MIFSAELAAKVLGGTKTETRRVASDNPFSPWWRERCRLEPGRSYAVQDGRGQPALARIEVVSPPRCELLCRIDEEGAQREGFDSKADFLDYWEDVNGPLTWGDGVTPGPLVWVIGFRLLQST